MPKWRGNPRSANPLALFDGWKSNPDAFARPGPPPAPPLPLRFTCRGCGSEVNPNTGICRGCSGHYKI